MSAKQMTAITQVHAYIREHFKPGDLISTHDITPGLQHLTPSSISASMWKLSTEEILLTDGSTCGSYHATLYMVSDTYMQLRGHEDREAPEPGTKRRRKRKQASRKRINPDHIWPCGTDYDGDG